MEQVVLRHLSGSKAGRVDTFPLRDFRDLLIGRDPAADVLYDPERDDLVGRRHARLSRDAREPYRFTITDLNSRNGTYVNKQRIASSATLAPGDLVQLGPGGPEFEVSIDPVPARFVKARPDRGPATLTAPGDTMPVPGLRVGQAPSEPASAEQSSTLQADWRVTRPAMPAPRIDTSAATVDLLIPASEKAVAGRATGDRMVTDARPQRRRRGVITATAVTATALAVCGFLWYHWPGAGRPAGREPRQAAGASMSAAEIARRFSPSTVLVEVGWKLTYQPTGAPVFHEYYVEKNDEGQPVRRDGQLVTTPIYVQLPDGTIEPSLALDKGPLAENQPIGGRLTGSGFVVTADGVILTSTHVAAAWATAYEFPPGPGLLLHLDSRRVERFDGAPVEWVPAAARVIGRKEVPGETVLGRLDYLDVTFAGSQLRVPATLARVSEHHDAATLRTALPQPTRAVELAVPQETVRAGSTVTVLGYAGLSSLVSVAGGSRDEAGERERRVAPDPAVMPGAIGRVVRDDAIGPGRVRHDVSERGDSYQLTVNPLGAGASGGPVFDDRGRVIGIFTAGRARPGDGAVSFATPIRYGIELLNGK